MRRISVWVCILGLALPGVTHAQTADVPPLSSFHAGDSWEWRRIDMRTKLEEGRLRRFVVKDADAMVFSNGSTTSQIGAAYIGEPAAKPWRLWPLEIGKKWTYDGTWKSPTGESGQTKQDVEVVAYEDVVTPAGTFKAFKLEYRGIFRNNNGYNGKQNDTFWYAPEAKADVKHIRDDGYNMYTRELVVYTRGPE